MSINRNIDPDSYDTGTELATDIADTLNYSVSLWLGRLANVSGTNAITADVDEATGFSALTDGALAVLVPAANNMGAVTLAVEGGSPNAVKTSDGSALAIGDLKSGRAVPIQYHSSYSGWRVLVEVPSQIVVDAQTDVPPYLIYDEVTSSGTWTAPHDCFVRIWLFGGGGAGYTGSTPKGGGGPATCIKDRVFMTSGQQLSLTIGNGGAPTSGNGGNGSASACTGPDSLSMSAGGGIGGTTSNGVGGTASGGDLNLAGATTTSSDGGICGLARKLTSRITNIGPFSAASALPKGGEGHSSGAGGGDAGNKGFAVIEYTTAIT